MFQGLTRREIVIVVIALIAVVALTTGMAACGTQAAGQPGNGQIKSPEVNLAVAVRPCFVQRLLLTQPITEHVDIMCGYADQ